MESVLLEFDANLKKDRDIEKVKKDVKLLKRKRQALQERENKVTGDINTGQVAEARSYRLPLSVLPQSAHAPSGQRGQPVLTQPQVQRLRSVAGLKQRLAASAICTGVTCVREADESKYMFDPYIGGKPHGPYVLRLKYTRWNLFRSPEALIQFLIVIFAALVRFCRATPSPTPCPSRRCSGST